MRRAKSIRVFASPGGAIAVTALLMARLGEPASAGTGDVICWEAEDYRSLELASFTVVTDTSASGGAYITTNGTARTTPDAIVGDQVTMPDSGDYDLYARVWAGDGSSDSFFTPQTFGTSPAFDVVNGIARTGRWTWINASEYAGDSSVGSPGVGSGWHKVGGRESGLRIDAFALGDDATDFADVQLERSLTKVELYYPFDGETSRPPTRPAASATERSSGARSRTASESATRGSSLTAWTIT